MNQTRAPESVDVAIVGYGPVGAVLADLPGRDGVRVAAFEPDRGIYRLPRAVHFDHEVRSVFQSFGLDDADLPQTAPILGYEFMNGERELLFRFDMDQHITGEGWCPDYMFHQPSLEEALRDASFLSGPGREREVPAFPPLGEGVFLPGAPLAGRRGLQAPVRGEAGEELPFDAAVGQGFVLLVRGAEAPELSRSTRTGWTRCWCGPTTRSSAPPPARTRPAACSRRWVATWRPGRSLGLRPRVAQAPGAGPSAAACSRIRRQRNGAAICARKPIG